MRPDSGGQSWNPGRSASNAGKSLANKAFGGGGNGSSGYRPIQRTYAPPSYNPGPIRSTGGHNLNFNNSARTNYANRLANYTQARNSFFNGLNNAYNKAASKYKKDLAKGKGGVEKNYRNQLGNYKKQYGLDKQALGRTRTGDLSNISQDYANRGIGASSGIYQQALKDYETEYQGRLKGITDNYNSNLGRANAGRAKSLGDLNSRYKKGLAGAAERRSKARTGYDKSHPKPGM